MNGQAAIRTGLKLAEYLAFERESTERHEYFRGEVYAMAGGSEAHNLIAANILRELGNALHDRPCYAYGSDMRVKAGELYTYPDVSALCGDRRFEDEAIRDTLLNPGALVEVLSDTTEAYDRGRKFDAYRSIPSLVDYVLVSQAQRLVEHFARQKDGSWILHVLRAGERLRLGSLQCDLAVDEIYLKV